MIKKRIYVYIYTHICMLLLFYIVCRFHFLGVTLIYYILAFISVSKYAIIAEKWLINDLISFMCCSIQYY